MLGKDARIRKLPLDDSSNGWANIHPARMPTQALSGAIQTDWLVIGAGYAGLSAANRLAENRPGDSITLLDAQAVGDGASGRSSGFVIGTPHVVGADLESKENAISAFQMSRYAGEYLWNIVQERNIDCGMTHSGQFMVARTEAGKKVLRDFHSNMSEIGVKAEMLRSADLIDKINTDYYPVACFTPDTLLLNPTLLVRGLADTLPSNVQLFEHSPVKSIQYGSQITATTDGGEVVAKKLILAVNDLAPEFQVYKGKLFSLQLFSSMTRQLTAAECASIGGHKVWGVLPVFSGAGATLRLTDDRRLVIRAGFKFAASFESRGTDYRSVQASHLKMLLDRFPTLLGLDIEHTWSGYITLSKNIELGFGQHADNVYSCVCQNGVGLSRGTYSGILAADMASERENPLVDRLLSRHQPCTVSPNPFLGLGVSATLMWHAWKNRDEN